MHIEKRQSFASLAVVRGITSDQWFPFTKGPVTRKIFPLYNVSIFTVHIYLWSALPALGQSNDWPCVTEITLKDMGQIDQYQATNKHKTQPSLILWDVLHRFWSESRQQNTPLPNWNVRCLCPAMSVGTFHPPWRAPAMKFRLSLFPGMERSMIHRVVYFVLEIGWRLRIGDAEPLSNFKYKSYFRSVKHIIYKICNFA